MTKQVALYILKKHHLDGFGPSELIGLLDDRFARLKPEVREAIKTIINPKADKWTH